MNGKEYMSLTDFDIHVNGDPTLRFFIRESKLDYDKLDWQICVKCSAIMVAINQLLDKKYK